MQLTSESLGQTMEALSTLVQRSENNTRQQSAVNLNTIATTLINVATFVNRSAEIVNETVNKLH